jgi:hypothetical protein
MGFVEDELKHLRDVISSLDSRIKQLEQGATGAAPIGTESLRMILIGPPGAGKLINYAIKRAHVEYATQYLYVGQAKELKRQRLKSAFPAVTWYVNVD